MFVLYQHFYFYAIYKIKINKKAIQTLLIMYKIMHKIT
ncbi:hypothetical protein HD73_4456 [Bacillus thuringiensis serovar kurstaki str. HD73]|nr:hypothetical protein HD73_4456 [Bacillus thuringiensis serovar kurstaki str. HD73]